MADIATLGLAVDSREVSDASRQLERIREAAGKAERAADSFGSRTEQAGRRAAAANDNVARSASRLNNVYAGLIRMAGGFAAAAISAFSVRPIFAFQDAIAEVSTLVDTASFDMRGLTKAALDMNTQFGGGASQQAKAFYSIISAGASSAAQATDILDASNRLAIGGVTTLATAADGLTSVLNAYGDRVSGAAEVSDALFVAMRAGKTTIGELSSGLGQVAPLAATLNVSFDELVASVSALTKGGIATSQAITGVRAVLAAIAKPSSEAAKLAGQLGIEFNAAGLEAKGFQGFLDELVQKTGGSTEQLALLFGGVEALVPIMALSGQAGIDFAAIMEQMGEKAGATQDAFDKMANSPGFQAGRLWAALETEVIRLGSAIAETLVPAMRFLADNMGRVVTTVATAVTAFGTYYVIAMGAAYLSTMTLVGALTLIRAALIRTGIGALVVLAGELVYQFTRLVEAAGGFGNAMGLLGNVATEVIQRIGVAFGQLPAAIADIAIQMGAKFADGIRYGVNEALLVIGDFMMKMNEVTGTNFNRPALLRPVSMDNPYAGAAANLGATISAPLESVEAIARVMADAARETESAATSADRMSEALASVAGADGAGGSGGAKAAKDAVKDLADEAKKAAEAAIDFGRDLVGGLVSDFRRGLEQGKGFWESFGNAALNALDKITDKLLNDVLDALFQVNKAGSGMGGGGGIMGFLGSLLGGGGGRLTNLPLGIGLYSQGGYTGPGGKYEPAGLVHKGEVVWSQDDIRRAGGVTSVEAMRRGAMPRMQAPANGNGGGGGGTSVVQLQLSPDLVAQILQQAEGQSVQISRQTVAGNEKRRQKLNQATTGFV